jgi:outer membrane protein
MIKKLIGTSCLFLFVVTATAFGQLKVGYMSTQEVLSQMPQRDSVEQELTSYIETKQQELEERVSAFQDSVAAYQQIRSSISQQQIKQEEQKLADMEMDLQQFRITTRAQIQQKRASLLQPLYNKMDEAMAAIAEENGLDFILNESTNTGEMVVFYSGNESLNVTEDVIQYIKENPVKN